MKTLMKVLLTAALLMAQSPREIPEYGGDPGTGRYKGQPRWCQATDTAGFKKNCGICDKWCDTGQESPKCMTHCRSKANCRCHPDCMVTGHHHKPKTDAVAP